MDILDIFKHDTRIWGIGFVKEEYKLIFDIDLILEYKLKEGYYKFTLCPSTVVLNNINNLTIDIDADDGLVINDATINTILTPKNIEYLPHGTKEIDIEIELMEGSISFRTIGGSLYIRDTYKLCDNTELIYNTRGGIKLVEYGEETMPCSIIRWLNNYE